MRLIVGVDETDQGRRTLEEAVALARDVDWEFTVVVYSDEEPVSEVERAVRDHMSSLEVDTEVEPLADEPGSRLVELAEVGEYDCIMLPGGRKSPLGKISLNSTIEFVLLNAQTSVTLVR